MNLYFTIIICILHNFYILGNYTFELIEELDPKYANFEIIDLKSFKIFKYIPQCINSINKKKNIYAQLFLNSYIFLHLYDNFDKIEQEEDGKFINSIENRKNYTDGYSFEYFKNLACGKEYYFVASMAKEEDYPYLRPEYFEFSILDASIEEINISPLISEQFWIIGRKKKEIIQYSHNQTKYAAILGYNAEIQILKNNETINYIKKEEKGINYIEIEPIEFENNQNYTIYLEGNDSPFIIIQFFNESKIFKIDLNKDPLPLYTKQYYCEIDISNYKLNDLILFKMFLSRWSNYRFRYQYRKDFSKNNFFYKGYFEGYNYIPIKKTIEDTSLIIFIEFDKPNLSFLNIIKDVEEIKSEFEKEIIGPKYYYIDNFELININAIGINASESFWLYEHEKAYKTSSKYQSGNYYITKIKRNSPETLKSMVIKFDSKNKIFFRIKKYNYPIFFREWDQTDYEFFQLCQGENPTNEIYFYIEEISPLFGQELFLPVFGSFDSYYISVLDINNLSDFDFEKIKEPNFYQIYPYFRYLKIKCKEPLMLKHFRFKFDSDSDLKKLDAGRNYYNVKYRKFTFNSSLVNNDLNIKITIYALEPKQSIKLIFNNETYIYTYNNNSKEYIFKYNK